jgi:hypothetical protein
VACVPYRVVTRRPASSAARERPRGLSCRPAWPRRAIPEGVESPQVGLMPSAALVAGHVLERARATTSEGLVFRSSSLMRPAVVMANRRRRGRPGRWRSWSGLACAPASSIPRAACRAFRHPCLGLMPATSATTGRPEFGGQCECIGQPRPPCRAPARTCRAATAPVSPPSTAERDGRGVGGSLEVARLCLGCGDGRQCVGLPKVVAPIRSAPEGPPRRPYPGSGAMAAGEWRVSSC